MKKYLVRIVIGLVVVLVVALVLVWMNINSIIKKAVESGGPKLTQVNVQVEGVNLSLLSGAGEIRGLVVGNPAGYKSPYAIKLDLVSLRLRPASLFSDKVVVESVIVKAPEITFEGDLKKNNLGRILANVQATAGGQKPATDSKGKKEPQATGPEKKLQVDEFVFREAKVQVLLSGMMSASNTLVLPNLELQKLGAGPEGITPAELTKEILQALLTDVAKQAAGSAVKNLGKEYLGDKAGAVSNAGGLFKSLLKK
jgi:hypothetical protein